MNTANEPTDTLTALQLHSPPSPFGKSATPGIKEFYKTLAGANCVDDSTMVGMMAGLASGIAGPRNTIIERAGPMRVKGADMILVDDDGRGEDLVERLLLPARTLQSHLINRFHSLDQGLLREVLGLGPGKEYSREARTEHNKAIFGNGHYPNVSHEIMLNLEMETHDPDLVRKELLDRLELVVRPTFLAESPTVRSLEKIVKTLHMANRLVWGGRDFTADDLSKAEIGKVLGLLKGGRVDTPPILCGGRKDCSQPCEVSWILKSGSEALARPEVTALFRDSLLLEALPVPLDVVTPADEVKSAFHAWQRILDMLLSERRKGNSFCHGIGDDRSAREFAERYDHYIRDARENGIHSRAVTFLPKYILCLPGFIDSHASPQVGIDECFRHSEILGRRHQRLWLRARNHAEVQSALSLAKTLLEKICCKQPIEQRDLIRTFPIQQKKLYVPTLGLMVEAGVITESPGPVYRVGAVSDVEKALKSRIENQHLKAVA